MARPRRLNEAGTYHHITARGVDKRRIFVDDGDRRQFLSLLGESRQRFGCRVLAFCLMDNHIHLTLLDDRGTLSKSLHFLNGAYAKKFNLKHGRTGHLFERRFWSSMIAADSYLTTCVKYVHRNPVEAGIVTRAEDYRWSSYSSYLELRSPPTFLDTSTILKHYGHDRALLQAETERREPQEPVLSQLQLDNPPTVVGGHCVETEAVSLTSSAAKPVPLSIVLEVCATVMRVPITEITRRTPGRRNDARSLAAFVAHRYVGHSLIDIAGALSLKSPAAASAVCNRFSERIDGPIDAQIREVLRGLPATC